jgi:hypothetical protein
MRKGAARRPCRRAVEERGRSSAVMHADAGIHVSAVMPADAGIHVFRPSIVKEDVDPGSPLRCGRDDTEGLRPG